MHTCEQLPRVVRVRTKHSLDLVSQKELLLLFIASLYCSVSKLVSKYKNYSLVDYHTACVQQVWEVRLSSRLTVRAE